MLVIGNFPWVTSATQGSIGGTNLPEKSNFQKFKGLDAVTGKANFDISESMLLEVFRWLDGRNADLAMLVKTAVARKVLAYAERNGIAVREARLIKIDAMADFGAAVDACLLVMRFSADRAQENHDYWVFDGFDDHRGHRVGHRFGVTIGDIGAFESSQLLYGKSPQKWRSGVKHDASSVMEFTRVKDGYQNGSGEIVDLEPTYLYPLMKGSDIGNPKKEWREKFILVPQKFVGEPTEPIRTQAPKTWEYLERHAAALDARGSAIYKNNPRFSIFGIGEYAFRPWRVAICGLYKSLHFRLIGPKEGSPVMFDDTVYFISFDTQDEATSVLDRLQCPQSTSFLSSLIFWDEKRPIKTSILNTLDWRLLDKGEPIQLRLPFPA
ncbi:MAG: SAM-dependent methyltransferase [Acidobacteriota bacterium]|nr:SAM-dependent methyltransferase [Acidobacteriota bacterium]